MPSMLKNLRVTRVDLVDNGANQDQTGDGAHVLLYKRAPTTSQEDEMPKKTSEMNLEELQAHATQQTEAMEKLQKDHEEQGESLATVTTERDELQAAVPVEEPVEDDVMKGLPESVVKLMKDKDEAIEKAQAQATEAQEIAKAERETRLTKEFIAKAQALPTLQGETSEVAADLRAIAESLDEEVAKRVMGHLTALDNLVAKSALFETLSRRDDGAERTASDEVEALAKKMVEEGTAETMEQARADVFTKSTSLAKRYREEQ